MTTYLKELLTIAGAVMTVAAGSAHAQTYTVGSAADDMGLPSEAIPRKPTVLYDWMKRPQITQYSPAGSSLPDWFKNVEIKAGGTIPEWCYTVLSWYTAYEAGGGADGMSDIGANQATNTRVQVRNLRTYMLFQTPTGSEWRLIDNRPQPAVDLWTYPFNALPWQQYPSGVRSETNNEGGNSILPVAPYFHHGYGNGKFVADAQQVAAVFVAMDFRLITHDASKPDDRDVAKYVVDVGADWYGTSSWKAGYAPGVGNGRYLLATKEWRTATMLVPNKLLGQTFTTLRANQPPLPLALPPAP